MRQIFASSDRVRPSGEYDAQFRTKRTLGTVIRARDADMYSVNWDGGTETETLHADFLLLVEEFVIVDSHGWKFPHAGRSRVEAIAVHVSVLWSNYLDEFPEIPPTLERGRLSPTQRRAWNKSAALGHRVIVAPPEPRTLKMGRPMLNFTTEQVHQAEAVWQDCSTYRTWKAASAAMPQGFALHRAYNLWGARTSTRKTAR